VAIKTIEKSYMKDDFSKRKVFQEVYLLKKIKHSNVIRLLEVFESQRHLHSDGVRWRGRSAETSKEEGQAARE